MGRVMDKILINAAMLLAIAWLGGCASMSSEECVNSDWVAIGYEDGSRGYTTDKFGSRRKACAKHGVTADFKAYQEGRGEGLVEFCQPSRGYNLGVSGGAYYGVCDVAMEEEFLDAYRVGLQLHSLRSNVNDSNSRIYSKEAELKRTKEKIRDMQAELISDDVTPQDRLLLLTDIKELAERSGELEAEIEQLVADKARHEHELKDYEQTVAAYGY
jgi:uncharacterized small protein (DUF1192 family)